MIAKPTRILFVNRMAATERGGGETFDLEISRHLAKMGCDVTFLTNIPLFGRAKQHVPKGVFLRSPMFPWFPWDKVKGGWRLRVWEFQRFEEKAARWIARHANEYDIIQICELPYLVSILKSEIRDLKSKIVMRLTAPNVHDMWDGIRLADALMASGTSIEKIRRQLRPDCHDIPNAVDVAHFHIDGKRKRDLPGIPPQAFICLYVARFQAFKNHALLLDAFSRLDSGWSYHLVLAGSGPLQKDSEARAGALGLAGRVHFLGEVPYSELPRVYRAADLMVISSDYESFCFAALEGMASGLPIVTTDCGWVPGLIGDRLPPVQSQWVEARSEEPGRFANDVSGQRVRAVPGGLVVGRHDAESMARAIAQMAADVDARDTRGAWNRAKAQREHGWDKSARKLLDLYQSLGPEKSIAGANCTSP